MSDDEYRDAHGHQDERVQNEERAGEGERVLNVREIISTNQRIAERGEELALSVRQLHQRYAAFEEELNRQRAQRRRSHGAKQPTPRDNTPEPRQANLTIPGDSQSSWNTHTAPLLLNFLHQKYLKSYSHLPREDARGFIEKYERHTIYLDPKERVKNFAQHLEAATWD